MDTSTPTTPGTIHYHRDGRCPLVRYSRFLDTVGRFFRGTIEPLDPADQGEATQENLSKLGHEADELMRDEYSRVIYANIPGHHEQEIGELLKESRKLFDHLLWVGRYMPSNKEERDGIFLATMRLGDVSLRIRFYGKPGVNEEQGGPPGSDNLPFPRKKRRIAWLTKMDDDLIAAFDQETGEFNPDTTENQFRRQCEEKNIDPPPRGDKRFTREKADLKAALREHYGISVKPEGVEA